MQIWAGALFCAIRPRSPHRRRAAGDGHGTLLLLLNTYGDRLAEKRLFVRSLPHAKTQEFRRSDWSIFSLCMQVSSTMKLKLGASEELSARASCTNVSFSLNLGRSSSS